MHAKEPPSVYLARIRTYLFDGGRGGGSGGSRSGGSSKHRHAADRAAAMGRTSTQVLRDLEISLRTNNIEWLREFLGDSNRGLDVLVDYLAQRLLLMRAEEELLLSNGGSADAATISSGSSSKRSLKGTLKGGSPTKKGGGGSSVDGSSGTLDFDGPRLSKLMRQSTKLKMGETTDDIHVCIMCLRAIMNNKAGFNKVIEHGHAINCIALSLVCLSVRLSDHI